MLSAVRDLDAQNRTTRLRWTCATSPSQGGPEALRASEERLRHSQRLEAVGRLAGGIAHSFNNLLAASPSQRAALRRLPGGEPRRAHVEEIQKAGERAAALTRQLLAFSRKQVLQPRVLHLNGVIPRWSQMLRRLIGEHIELGSCSIPSWRRPGRPGQIEQVILNLAVNARDAMPDGGRLTLETADVELAGRGGSRPSSPPAPTSSSSVSDTGPGMTPEVLEHALRAVLHHQGARQGDRPGARDRPRHRPPERRPDPGRERAGAGHPLPILLPRVAEPAEAAAAPQPRPRRSRAAPRSCCWWRTRTTSVSPPSRSWRARATRCSPPADAAEALAVAEAHRGPIHILVTDVVMPGLSGSQLAERLLHRRPEIQVLYISGYPEDSISHHGVLNAGQHFLQKPFPPGQFLEKVREVLDARAAAQAG